MPIKEPGVLLRVRDVQGDVWTYNPADGLWYTQETRPFNWAYLTQKWAPLTEVLPEPEGKIKPPWDDAIVAALNAFQERGDLHPFTCPRDHFTDGEVKLRATRKGWACTAAPACGYTQDWAHSFMADVPPTQQPQEATIPPSLVSVDTGTPIQDDSGQLKAELADALDVALDRNRMNQDAIQGWDYDEDLGPIADALLAAGWRPPLPKWEQDLNDGIGIDNTQRVYTEADLVDACAQTMNRERDGQTVEWGFRDIGADNVRAVPHDQAVSAAVPDVVETVYRLVHPWKVDED